MDFNFLKTYWMFFLEGAYITLFISIFSAIFGILTGTFIGMGRMSENKIIKFITSSYVEFIRGTPLIVQIYIVFYGLPSMGIEFSDMTAGIIAMSINSSAYVAEIFRAGIQSIDKGQFEAAKALGMNKTQMMKHVIIPQAIKNVIPALGNELVVIVKESAVVSIIGLKDLMYKADTIRGNTFLAFEPLLIAAFVYFIMTFTLSRGIQKIERRMA